MEISPKDFLKQRRPSKFSDSVIQQRSKLTRPTLESHLLNLSSRNEQDAFEQFAVSLCEVEICPNIKPNTGPAGGGDGKTDAETYPVADDTAIGWYIGYETTKSDKSWAFAISAKKAWQSKLTQDLEKIFKTGRSFSRTYFVTNQYVKADKRKKLEEELGEKYKTELHILDLSWILGRVFDNKRLSLAIQKLGIEGATDDVIERGPNDVRRAKSIAQLDEEIEQEISKQTVNYTTVRDAIDAAVLSREQELPRIEVEGRLDRAIRLADRYGTTNQKFMARYQKCWTAFWYFEDFQMLKDCYNDAQRHALKAGGIDNLEKLSNLHTILMTAKDRGTGIISKAFFDSKTKVLLAELEKIATNQEAPSSSLFARVLLAQASMTNAVRSHQSIEEALGEFEKIIDECGGLPGFPFDAVTELLSIIGGVIGDNDSYDAVFAKVRRQAAKRDGEKRSAEMVLERAKSLLNEGKNYKTIQLLGSALPSFQKEETQDEANEAFLLMGLAYENVGLLWAARASYLNAASTETTRFYKEDEASPMQFTVYRSITNIELRLGRIPQFLQWYKTLGAFLSILPADEWHTEKLEEEKLLCDLRLGVTILTCSEDAKHISRLLPILQRAELDNSALAVKYRMGREDLYDKEFTDAIAEDERQKFFENWASQAPENIASDKLLYSNEISVQLSTHVLGCEITVHFENNILNTMTAESILACIESILATALLHKGASAEPNFDIWIENDNSAGYKVKTQLETDNSAIKVTVPEFNPHSISGKNQGILGKSIQELAIKVVGSIVMFAETKKSLEKIFGEERAFDRSVNFTSSYIRLGNVIGYKPKYKLSEWSEAKNKPVSVGEKPNGPLAKRARAEHDFRKIKPEEIGHDNLSTMSVIKTSLWEKAGWKGAFYSTAPSSNEPPILAIIFSNPDAGGKILQDWHDKYGDVDDRDAIRVAIMRDIDSKYPADYRVGISANLEVADIKGRLVSSVTRIHTMNAESKENLDMFLKQYRKVGSYYLAAALIGPDGTPMLYRYKVKKNLLVVKIPDDVGENDQDSVLLGKSNRD